MILIPKAIGHCPFNYIAIVITSSQEKSFNVIIVKVSGLLQFQYSAEWLTSIVLKIGGSIRIRVRFLLSISITWELN